MSNKDLGFLVSLDGVAPKNLKNSIRRVKDTSAGFVQSWTSGQHDDAYETSQEAFEHFDYIQNELLRQRDAYKNESGWADSAFNLVL